MIGPTIPTLAWTRRHLVLLLLVGGGVVLSAGAAFAFWTIALTTGPQGSGKGAQLNPVTAVTTAVSATNGSVTVGWTAPATQLRGASYVVTRTGPGSPVVLSSCTSASCTDTGPLEPATTYTYAVVAALGTNWQSSAVTKTALTLTPTLSITVSAGPYTAGSAITITGITAKLGSNTDVTYGGARTLNWSGLSNSPSGQAPSYPTTSIAFNSGVASLSSPTFTAFKSGSNTMT